ncbi:MAG: hypothetical protein U9R25_05780, partial [Chloroflexota bacterium]|nr:hypothetical protein [Chloroflexota bacterium]
TPEPADTATPEPADTATPEPVDTATPEPVDTATPEPTDTPTPVDTDTPTATATPSPAPTDTPSPEPTATATPTPTPTATATSTPKPTNTPTVEPDPTDTATPASSVTLVPVPTATPAATSQALRRVPGLDTLTNGGETAAFPYTMVRFLGDMTDEGHDVVRTPARIVKPYLSVFGVIILIDGHPVQAFEYPDDETLAADMMGFGPGADSHGSHLLFWEAPPRVWRNGRLLLLTVGPDDFTSDAIASVLGDPIIGN